MAIKGLTDRFKTPLDQTPQGKAIRIGYLGKGTRTGFGKGVKLTDEKHFVFSSSKLGALGEQIEKTFHDVYGDDPQQIDDVRIATQIAGNFDILDCAWLIASKHTKNGSVFLAQSNGEDVKRLRDESTGKVNYKYDDDIAHDSITRQDSSKHGSIQYKDKWYPWEQRFSVDLIFPKFNAELYRRNLSGFGIVTLGSTSTYDIPTLIDEYYGILHEVTGIFSNPMDSNYDHVLSHLPLRDIPLRLFRSEDATTTPDFRAKDAGKRLNTKHWLVHWQLSAEFSAAAQIGRDQRTQQALATIANVPQIAAPSNDLTIDEFNDMAFGETAKPVVKRLPEPKQDAEIVDFGDFVEEIAELVDESTGEIVEPVYEEIENNARDADDVKQELITEAGNYPGKPSKEHLFATRASLGKIGKPKEVKSIMNYVFGVTSSNDFTKGHCMAFMNWIDATKTEDDKWQVSNTVKQEAQRLLTADLKAKGQQELL